MATLKASISKLCVEMLGLDKSELLALKSQVEKIVSKKPKFRPSLNRNKCVPPIATEGTRPSLRARPEPGPMPRVFPYPLNPCMLATSL